MSGIIKSGNLADLSSVRPISALPPTAAISRADEERDRLRKRVASLEEELRKRDAAIVELRADVDRAFETGREEGRKIGLAEAEDRQSARLSLLETGIGRALGELSSSLQSLERLSAVLARECLEKILGNPKDYVKILSRIIGVQTARIDKAMLLGIELSKEDFPDDESLAALSAQTGRSLALTASADLPSGACVMNLRLGRAHVGIDQQWGTLREILGEMAKPEDAE